MSWRPRRDYLENFREAQTQVIKQNFYDFSLFTAAQKQKLIYF